MPSFVVPCIVVLAGGAQAGLECARARLRSGRPAALLVSVVAFALSYWILYAVLEARNCVWPGTSSVGALGVGIAGLTGMVSAEKGRGGWKLVAWSIALSLPFGYWYALGVIVECRRNY